MGGLCYAAGKEDHAGMTRTVARRQAAGLLALLIALLLGSAPAHAFRCGNRIVVRDMHETEVRVACGEPTTMRHLRYTIRAIEYPYHRGGGAGFSKRHFPGYGHLTEEVIVTEYVYNFGPRKLMRRLVFEGGVLESIETLGYGYIEKKAAP